MNKEPKRFGFSVMDLILLILIIACVVAGVFQEQLHSFFGEEEKVQVEYTFLIENVTAQSMNHPTAGDVMLHNNTREEMGVLLQVDEKKTTYQNIDRMDQQLEILTLTCKASASAKETKTGYVIGGVAVKPGAEIPIRTDRATFLIVVTMVKPVPTSR